MGVGFNTFIFIARQMQKTMFTKQASGLVNAVVCNRFFFADANVNMCWRYGLSTKVNVIKNAINTLLYSGLMHIVAVGYH